MSSASTTLTLSAALALLVWAEAQGGTDQSAPTHSGTTAGSSSQLQQVTVSAERARLAKRVSKFVDQIAAADNVNGEGLPLWHAPVCPSVTGLTRKQGEYLLWRISEIARGAGVPLAGETCRPNLFVFVSARPGQLLEAMDKRKLGVTFGNSAPRIAVDEFIANAQPVKVWYQSYRLTPEYAFPSYNVTQSTHPCLSAEINTVGGMAFPPVICDSERASHITATALVPVFSYVYVIVDGRQLRGVTLQQLADYVGMVGLAQIKPNASLGDAPTILKLFGGSHQDAPPTVSDWDRAFLKSLYATEQRMKDQRDLITDSTVQQLEH